MKFEFNITKKLFWIFIALSVLLLSVFVYAELVFNPGHTQSEISVNGEQLDIYIDNTVNQKIKDKLESNPIKADCYTKTYDCSGVNCDSDSNLNVEYFCDEGYQPIGFSCNDYGGLINDFGKKYDGSEQITACSELPGHADAAFICCKFGFEE